MSMPLLKLADGVVIVGRAGHTRETSAQRLVQLLAQSDVRPLGVAANCLSTGRNGAIRLCVRQRTITDWQADGSMTTPHLRLSGGTGAVHPVVLDDASAISRSSGSRDSSRRRSRWG